LIKKRKGEWFMKRMFVFIFILTALAVSTIPCTAADDVVKMEVLQVTDIDAFQMTYDAMINALAKQGYTVGENLKVNRVMLDYDIEKSGFFDKIGLLFKIKSEGSRIADAKPDIAVTIGTPATKYARDKITSAGVPLVFTAVAIPEAAGCKSLTEGGPGVTGATLYMNMNNAMKIIKAAFPDLKTIGMVCSDDENGIAHVEEATKNAPAYGMKVISKQVNKKDRITPHLEELKAQGMEAFAVPLDTYFGIRDYEIVNDLDVFSRKNKMPVVSFAVLNTKGSVLSVGTEFNTVGVLAAENILKILKDGKKPDELPIRHQEDLNIIVDVERMQSLGIQVPIGILQIAKPVK